MPQLEPLDWAPQLIWLVITFTFLYLMMTYVALPRIGSVIDARMKRIADDLAAAETLRRETEEAIAAYEQALAEAKQRAHAISDEGRAKLKAEIEGERQKLEAQLAAQGAEAEARVTEAKNAAMKDVNAVAADVASDVVRRLIGVAPSDAEVKQAVAEARKG